jgi:hypothetical protein
MLLRFGRVLKLSMISIFGKILSSRHGLGYWNYSIAAQMFRSLQPLLLCGIFGMHGTKHEKVKV